MNKVDIFLSKLKLVIDEIKSDYSDDYNVQMSIINLNTIIKCLSQSGVNKLMRKIKKIDFNNIDDSIKSEIMATNKNLCFLFDLLTDCNNVYREKYIKILSIRDWA